MRSLLLGGALVGIATSALAQDPHAGHVTPPATSPAPMAGMDHSQMAGMEHDQMAGMDHSAHSASGALGAYPMTREASGTAWQPDASAHSGWHTRQGPWTVMTHATLNAVYDDQGGPRGDEKTFVSGMVMTSAMRELGERGTLRLRAMLSPDPLMGRRGYPLLLASGETADGRTPLVDRQHPHDLFMELSASYSYALSDRDSVFVYAGLPGEPAFGPPAFMHRLSILDSPEAPITHHWLDSTHIVFGVVTAGFVHDNWKVEVSRFKGREPDEHRYDIESPKLDSTAARISWNPTENLSLQGSWARAKDVEQLEPGEDQTKWSASAIYTVPIGDGGWWSTTAAWGRRSSGHEDLDAWALESAVKPNRAWTVFGRAERTENNELTFAGGHHGPTYDVGKVSFGAVHDWRVAEHVSFGLGGLYAWNWVPRALEPSYGGDPNGGMAFIRLKIE
jgi:hypothetical protein